MDEDIVSLIQKAVLNSAGIYLVRTRIATVIGQGSTNQYVQLAGNGEGITSDGNDYGWIIPYTGLTYGSAGGPTAGDSVQVDKFPGQREIIRGKTR